MKQRSPTLEGFKAILRRPSFGLAEMAWRWSFGLATAVVVTFSILEFFDTLPLTRAEMFLLRTRYPVLIGHAILHIFRGSAPRAVATAALLALALGAAWIAIASLGRAATLQALLNHFREMAADETETGFPREEQNAPWKLRSLVGLNALRVGATLAAAVGCLGALLLAKAASPPTDPSPGSAVLIFFMMTMFIGLAWSMLNWFLSLASIFVVGEGEDALGAIAASVEMCRVRAGSVFAAGTWFGVAHLTALIVASSAVAFPLAFAGVLPAGLVLGGVLLVILMYFAVADFLYVARLAAFVAIMELPEAPALLSATSPPHGAQHSAVGGQAEASAVDPRELILSDLPTPTS